MKSKHDVRAQQSRRRFLADTALGAAGLGLAEVPSFLAVLWPYQGRPCSELWGLMTHPSTLRMI